MDSERLEDMWAQVLPLLNKAFENNCISSAEQFSMYNSVTGYLSRLHEEDSEHPDNTRLNTIGSRGWLVYVKLKMLITSFCKSLSEKCAELEDEDLLLYYSIEWKRYERTYSVLNFVFSYLNKYYISNHRSFDEDAEVCYRVEVLFIITWKNTIFEEYYGKIIKTANELINRERQGSKINDQLIFDLVKSLLELGICDDGINPSKCVYTNYFEKSFLEETEHFYVMESSAFLEGESDFTEYIKLIKRRLLEEGQRVIRYLDSTTGEKVLQILQSSLIGRHLEDFYASFKKMLTSENNDSIKLLYWLISKYVDDISEFANIFLKHVNDQGLSSIKGCSEVVVKNPKIYLDTIMEVYKKYMNLMTTELSGNTAFKSAIEKATARFVNKNALTMEPNTTRKTSELITKYCDQLLRNTDPNQKEQLDEVITVFAFIEDKDVFQDYYMKLLAKRLVNSTSNDEELESYMILKMKAITGAQSVATFERMVKDIQLSKDINVAFAQNNQESLDVDFNIMVLRFCSWSFASSPRHNLPLELEKCVVQFNKFYSEAYSGKKLNWFYNLSRGEIITNHFKSRYTIQVSTRQICILLLFNSSDSWTVSQIEEQTNIDLDIVLQIIQILLKAKFLTCKSAEDLTANSTVCLNKNYNNKKHRVNINVPLKTEAQREQVAIDKNINNERMYVIQATIVRIMKSQKTVKHVELTSKVLEDLSSQFKPKIELINKNIQSLVDKDYMKLSETEPNTYDYVA